MIALTAAIFTSAAAQQPQAPSCESVVVGRAGPATGKPLPRFESVKADEANFRRGPGVDYGIDWVLRLPGLPVCIVSEFEQWRRVELPTGERGWLHAALLSDARFVLFAETDGAISVEPNETAPSIAAAPKMAPMRLLRCDGSWCEAEFNGATGFARRARLWGVRPVDEPN